MTRFKRVAGVAALFVILAGEGRGIEPKAVDAAIKRGADYLKASFTGPGGAGIIFGANDNGIGPTALSGIALLEAKVPASDPAIKKITAAVRDAAYKERHTYRIALSLIYLDILEDPADVPLIQMLAVRLLAGQNSQGGWTYICVDTVPPETEKWLRGNLTAIPPEPAASGKKPVGKLHPNVERYRGALASTPPQGTANIDDNSNTQFGIIGLWLARKHGVPVENALNAVERRFLASQDPNGGWSYSIGISSQSTGSMTAAGLLGLATGIARRDSYREKNKPRKDQVLKTKPKANDPFFTPVEPKAKKGEPEKKTDPSEKVRRTPAVQRGLAALGAFFAAKARGAGGGGGEQPAPGREYYFLWSVERVGVIFGVDKIGGLDWYDTGGSWLLANQNSNGSWGVLQTPGGPPVSTSFALLFLCKADLLRDLSSKFRDGTNNELRSGNAAPAPANTSGTPAALPKNPGNGAAALPAPQEDESTRLANLLLAAPAKDWSRTLGKLRDAKGGENTRGLVLAIHRLDGNRKKEAREALAERLTRMSATTLKGMMGSEDAEWRRGAVLAAAMRDDKAHVPDLIDRLTDDDAAVVRAAHAGLKSLTSEDFGPKNVDATKAERQAAASAWRAWWARQKPKK